MVVTQTNWSNVSSLSDMLTLVNTNTQNWGWVGMLFTIFFVALISMINFGIEVALMGASFGCLIISLILVSMGLIAWQWVLFFVGMLLVMFGYAIWSSDRH